MLWALNSEYYWCLINFKAEHFPSGRNKENILRIDQIFWCKKLKVRESLKRDRNTFRLIQQVEASLPAVLWRLKLSRRVRTEVLSQVLSQVEESRCLSWVWSNKPGLDWWKCPFKAAAGGSCCLVWSAARVCSAAATSRFIGFNRAKRVNKRRPHIRTAGCCCLSAQQVNKSKHQN